MEVHVIGGAFKAAELDAKAAIDQAVRLAGKMQTDVFVVCFEIAFLFDNRKQNKHRTKRLDVSKRKIVKNTYRSK